MTRLLGLDVSFWQGEIDFARLLTHPVEYVFIRAGQNTRRDTRWERNITNLQDRVVTGAYWFYDWRPNMASTEEQGRMFREVVGGRVDLPLVIDLEIPSANWSPVPFPSRSECLEILRRFKQAASPDRKMILYTNSAALRKMTPVNDFMRNNFDLWIASWPLVTNAAGQRVEVNSAAQIPANFMPRTFGWNWTFWQFTSKLPGRDFGMASHGLDGNVFRGRREALREYAGLEQATDLPVLSNDEKLSRLWVAHPELHG